MARQAAIRLVLKAERRCDMVSSGVVPAVRHVLLLVPKVS
jgi:hypothetical protein